MPTDPHTWAAGDFFTASIANGDFYRYNGQEFFPNGVLMHARKPIYKSMLATAGDSTASGAFADILQKSGGSDGSTIIGDTGGIYGAFTDQYSTGDIRLNVGGGGGYASTPGGVMLAIAQAYWASMSGSNDSVQAGFGQDEGSPDSTTKGAEQKANSAQPSCPIYVDLLNGYNSGASNGRWNAFSYNGGAASHSPQAPDQTDGSGRANRVMTAWASVYPINGFTATNGPAPTASWSNSSTLTASLLNGNTGIRDVFRVLNMPPMLRVIGSTSSGQSIAASTTTTVALGTTSYDSYSGWNASTNTYTVPFGGLYLVHGVVNIGSISGGIKVGANINGTNYWGPYGPSTGAGNQGAAKLQVFSLNAGDTIQLTAYCSAAATTATNAVARLCVLWLCGQGTPSPLPSVPDTSFRWTAGSPGSLTGLFNSRVANDLTFLIQRPYLMAYQTVAQAGLSMGTPKALVCDTVGGIVHSDTGDNYSGWTSGTSNKYTAQVSGWYLAVGENFFATPTLTATPSCAYTFLLSPAGANPWDYSQQQSMITTGSNSPGAAGIMFYYLRAGDTITPGGYTINSSNTTLATSVVNASHFELVWMGA